MADEKDWGQYFGQGIWNLVREKSVKSQGILQSIVCGNPDWGFGPYQICTNDESMLTLTYFMARSNLIPNAFIWGKS